MTSLFDDLKEGLEEVIAFAKGEGPARVTRSEIESAVPNKQHWYVTDYYPATIGKRVSGEKPGAFSLARTAGACVSPHN